MRFLIDECCCHDLVAAAIDGGYEAHHIDRLDLKGTADRDLMPRIIADSFTFVTNNAVDFRRLFATEELHAGLVILLPNVRRALQVKLFAAVLADLAADDDVVNKAIEADFTDASCAAVCVNRYDLSV